ncbi:PD-(D/E)XK nuclease family protein, partial [Balneolaceae bacterium ANBcel3]|nr:PD-(D/E)XK nuclease family protein [Balneolaceae bacterium ANBcel3]
MRIEKAENAEQVWEYLLREANPDTTLVLVGNLLTARDIRRKWQQARKGFAPDIRTLEDWIKELALHSLSQDSLPEIILGAEDRTLWLEQWLLHHADERYRRFSGIGSVTAISNIIGKLYRSAVRPGQLLDKVRSRNTSGDKPPPSRLVLAELIYAFEQEMKAKKWACLEELPMLADRIAHHMIGHKSIVLYLIDEMDTLQEQFLKRIQEDASDSAPEFLKIEMSAREHYGCSDEKASEQALYPRSGCYMEVFHHPRMELEYAVRHILATIEKQEEVSPDHRKKDLCFDDFVILTGDLSHYEGLIPDMAARFEVPLYTSRGPSLISHPFVHRFLTYLKLELNGFEVDDVARVFSDNRMSLPELPEFDEQKAPNIRHFSQFCRKWNLRTLKEAEEGLGPIMEKLLQKKSTESEEDHHKRKEAVQRDREFYSEVIRHLEAMRGFYKVPDRQSLVKWMEWARQLLRLQENLKSKEANEARRVFEVILDKTEVSSNRLELQHSLSQRDFFKLLELRLKETRERVQEIPGGILVTEISQLPEVHDSIVYVLGLHENGFPKAESMDFLQFRYEKALQELTGRDGSEAFETGRRQLARLLASTSPRFLSRPSYIAQKAVMASPLWIDLESFMNDSDQQFRGWDSFLSEGSSSGERASYDQRLMCQMDRGLWMVQRGAQKGGERDLELSGAQEGEWMRWFRSVANMEQCRREAHEMGRYDGVVSSRMATQWLKSRDNLLNLSISRLNTFATSPIDYFFKFVLKLEPLHDYKDDAESSVKGTLLHEILQNFYSDTVEEGAPVRPLEDIDAAQKRMNSIRDRLLKSYEYQLGNPESPFPGLLKKNVERATGWFLEKEVENIEMVNEKLDTSRPAVFYDTYGFSMEQSWSFEENVEGVHVVFRGIVDRIDLTGDGSNAIIYDYKTGTSGCHRYKRDILTGKGFQLPIYGRYLQKKGIPRFLAGYYVLPLNGRRRDVARSFELGSAELIQEESLLK